jgi:hypothetical protein
MCISISRGVVDMVWSERVRLILPTSASMALKKLEEKIAKLQKIKEELEEMTSIIKIKGGEITEQEEEELTDIINGLCAEFENCETCPAKYNCDLGASRTCGDMHYCKSCPKLKECFREWVSKWC